MPKRHYLQHLNAFCLFKKNIEKSNYNFMEYIKKSDYDGQIDLFLIKFGQYILSQIQKTPEINFEKRNYTNS